MIRRATSSDADEIAAIYNYYILNSIATFEETIIDGNEMDSRMQSTLGTFPWIVYEEGGHVIGYAYAAQLKPRSAYKYSVESSVYLKYDVMQKGIGSKLYSELIKILIEMNVHAIIGGISLPNESSVRLHEKLGFEKVAQYKEVGFKFEKWIDVGYWQLMVNQNS